jgi:hypothetical protein
MGLVVVIAQPVGRYMGVNLRGGQAAVPKQFLYAANVGTAIEQVGRKAVAQGMGTGARVEAGGGQVGFELPADTAGSQSAAVFVQKDGVWRPTSLVDQKGPPLEPLVDCFDSLRTE